MINRCDVCSWKMTADLVARGVIVGAGVQSKDIPPAAYVATGEDASQWFECEKHVDEKTKGHTGSPRASLQPLEEWNAKAQHAVRVYEGKEQRQPAPSSDGALERAWQRTADLERWLGRCEIALRVVRKFIDAPTPEAMASAAANARIVIDALDDD